MITSSGITGYRGGSIDVTDFKTVSTLRDLPSAVNGVITLTSGAYMITTTIDLLGSRILCTGIVAIFGTSSETSLIKSTGLGAGLAMITSAYSLPMRDISLTSPAGAKVFSLVTADSTQAVDFTSVNFVNCETVGAISGFNNFIINDSAFLSSAGLTFDGTIGTIGLNNTLINSSTGTVITLAPTLTISRRLRINYCSIRITGGTGIDFSTSTTVPNEGYILDTVVFSGGGTYLAGVAYNDNKSKFLECSGINNSNTIGLALITANATATTITVNVPIKAAGTYTLESISQRFSQSSNQLVCNSALLQSYKITAHATLTSINNNVVGIYIAKNNTVIANSVNYTTTNGAGRSENAACLITSDLVSTDVVDLWVVNTTGSNNITVEYMTLFIELIK
jgi:hypothetical protein